MAGQLDRFINIFVETKDSDKKLDDVISKVDKLSDVSKKNTKSLSENGGAMGLLGAATGGLSNDFKDAVEAAEGFGISLKGLRGAIIATGIGALAIVLLELVSNWEKWSGVIDGSTSAMEDLNTELEVLRNNYEELQYAGDLAIQVMELEGKSLQDIATQRRINFEEQQANLIKQLETEKKALDVRIQSYVKWNTLTYGLIGNQEKLKEAVENVAKIEDQLKKLTDKNYLDELKTDNEINAQKKKNSDELAKKREANAKAYEAILKSLRDFETKLTNDIANINAKTEEDKLKLLQASEQKQLDAIKLSNDKKVKAQELLNEKYRLLNLKNSEDRLKEATEFLRKQEEALAELNDKSGITALENKQKQELLDLENTRLNEEEKQLAILNINEKYRILRGELEAKNAADDEAKRIEANNKRLAEEEEYNRMLLDAEIAYQEAKRNALDTGLNILQQFAGKNKAIALGILAVQKGLAIADVVVNASKSIATQTASLGAANMVATAFSPLTGGQPWVTKNTILATKGIATTKIAAAASIASILASGIGQASQIMGGGAGGAGGGGGGGAEGGGAPQAQFNIVGTSGTNQLAATIGAQQQQPINAYVVGSDVSTQQSLDRNRVNNATFL
jgi:hypothetical protein